MNGIFAAWLSSWSRHTPTKSRYMSSTTGRMPAIAAPTPRPMTAVSEIGVSRTRSPNCSCSPRVSPKTLPPAPTSMPATNTRSSSASSDLEGGADRVHRAEHRRVVGDGAAARWRTVAGGGRSRTASRPRAREPAGGVDRFVELAARPMTPSRRSCRRRRPSVARRSAWTTQRVARLPLLHLVGGAVALRVALVVAVPPVGGRLDDERSRAGAHRLDSVDITDAVATTSLPSTAT